MVDTRETVDLEKELKLKIQTEVDEVDGMGAKSAALHLHSLSHCAKAIHADYHILTLPFRLLKQEVQLMKNKFPPDCLTNELGGYAQVPFQDYQVVEI